MQSMLDVAFPNAGSTIFTRREWWSGNWSVIGRDIEDLISENVRFSRRWWWWWWYMSCSQWLKFVFCSGKWLQDFRATYCLRRQRPIDLNPLKIKHRLLYVKIQSVPHS